MYETFLCCSFSDCFLYLTIVCLLAFWCGVLMLQDNSQPKRKKLQQAVQRTRLVSLLHGNLTSFCLQPTFCEPRSRNLNAWLWEFLFHRGKIYKSLCLIGVFVSETQVLRWGGGKSEKGEDKWVQSELVSSSSFSAASYHCNSKSLASTRLNNN